MSKQFLINYDGSIPKDVDLEKLRSLDIICVIPVPKPIRYSKDFIWVEGEPEVIKEGLYRQTWVSIPYVEPIVEEDNTIKILEVLNKLTRLEKLFLFNTLKSMTNDNN